jgi:hypothetical protein
MLAAVTRSGAQADAARELSKRIYREQQPSLTQQLINKVLELLAKVFQQASHASPGGGRGLLALLAVVIALIVAVRLRSGPLARSARLPRRLELAATVSAAEHRRRADAHAAEGRYAEAIRERLRALVADLERRAVLEPRPARTADEMAAEAGALLPSVAVDLRRAACTFDDVWYGGRPATAAMDAELRAIDQQVQQARTGARQSEGAASAWGLPR